MLLENDILSIDFHESAPVVKSYRHKATGELIDGDANATPLRINGTEVPWSRMEIATEQTDSGAVFRITCESISFSYAFELAGNELLIRLSDIRGPLESIGFNESPILRVSDPEYQFARVTVSEPDGWGKKWWTEQFGEVGSGESEARVIHGCLYHPKKLCVFAHSNFPLLPEVHGQSRNAYEVSLADYRYKVRTKTMWPLEVKVVFLEDYNGDGIIDWSDFALWVNRSLPDADELYRKSISYKIFMKMKGVDVATDGEQAAEIIRATHNASEGIPQLIYLVGWQFDGHDDQYPALNGAGQRLGGASAIRKLVEECRERYGALVSYHINIDDAYEDSPEWDPSYMHEGGVVHALDWENGHFVRRMNEMIDLVPVERTLHIDNTRICNTYTKDFDGIGELEELFCGLYPMAQWLQERGISLTTEGSNGMPMDSTLIFDGWWHYESGLMARQMLHRKIVGGGTGRHCGELTAKDYALGSNIHVDFSYRRDQALVSYVEDFRGMLDRIFLGSLLYLYFLERELTVCRVESDGQTHIEYDDDTVVEITSAHTMTVTKGDMVIAKDNDTRCIPLNDALYIYAQIGDGEVMTFMLPPEWRGKKIRLTRLTRDGAEVGYMDTIGIEPIYTILDDRIVFRFMIPYEPYKATLA